MYCFNCGKEIADKAVICIHCGCATQNYKQNNSDNVFLTRGKNRLIALLLCLFLGTIGIHRFYVGKNATGVAMLILTLSFIGTVFSIIWAIIDFVMILSGDFTTVDGQKLSTEKEGF